jgi:hypothetical protein
MSEIDPLDDPVPGRDWEAPIGSAGSRQPQIPRSPKVEPLPLEPEPDPPPRRTIPVGIPVQPTAPAPVSPGVMPAQTPAAASAPSTSSATSSSSDPSLPTGIAVEPREEPVKGPRSLDVCPSCGAPMRGPDTLVCVRCGFDLKTMKKVGTATGAVEVSSEELSPEGDTISRSGRGDLWLPLGMAAVSAAILLIAYVSGAHGLFPSLKAVASSQGLAMADVPFLTRIFGLLRFIVVTCMTAACGVAALMFMAHLLGQKLGDLRLTVVRMLAIATTVQLARLIDFSSVPLEWIVETVLQIAAFVGFSLLLLHLKPKDALTLAGATVLSFVALWLCGAMIVWAMSPG